MFTEIEDNQLVLNVPFNVPCNYLWKTPKLKRCYNVVTYEASSHFLYIRLYFRAKVGPKFLLLASFRKSTSLCVYAFLKRKVVIATSNSYLKSRSMDWNERRPPPFHEQQNSLISRYLLNQRYHEIFVALTWYLCKHCLLKCKVVTDNNVIC